jgi:hypothetical protein
MRVLQSSAAAVVIASCGLADGASPARTQDADTRPAVAFLASALQRHSQKQAEACCLLACQP